MWMAVYVMIGYGRFFSTHRFDTFTRLTLVSGIALLLYSVIFFFAPRDALPRLFFLYFLTLAFPGILAWRWLYGTLFTILPTQHRVLIVGLGERGQFIARILHQTAQLNYQPVGYVDTRQSIVAETATMPDGLPVVGPLTDLPALARRLRVQEVVLAIDHALDDRLFELLMACQAWGVGVVTMPDLHEKLQRSIPVQHIDSAWTLHMLQNLPVFSRLQLLWKRVFDVTISLLALLLAAPLMLVVALAICLDDRSGPVLYQQTRVGRGGRLFQIYKFRTMVSGGEGDGRARWAVQGDPRITPVGHLLRKTRLDELPQFINILKGEMSLVGPRPERPEFIAMLEQEIPFYHTRLLVKPGLTGWAQVQGNYNSDIEGAINKLEYDLYYLHHWSFWLDVYIIFKTASVVLKMKGL